MNNVCGAYEKLNTFDVKEYYTGRIIKGVGYGNLKIPDEIVENWCIKTKIDKIM